MSLLHVRASVILWLAAAVSAGAASDLLARQVTIYGDTFGVPHIVGETEEATFFGYGYAQAEDHLERMMIQYRDAQGRRAEVQGFRRSATGTCTSSLTSTGGSNQWAIAGWRMSLSTTNRRPPTSCATT